VQGTSRPAQNHPTDTDLSPIIAALADLGDTELASLIDAPNGVPQTAPGLLAWIDSAFECEVNRRRGFDYPLQPPEDAVNINAATVVGVTFLEDSRTVASFPNSRNWGIAVTSDDYRLLAFALAASSDRRSISAARPGMVIWNKATSSVASYRRVSRSPFLRFQLAILF